MPTYSLTKANLPPLHLCRATVKTEWNKAKHVMRQTRGGTSFSRRMLLAVSQHTKLACSNISLRPSRQEVLEVFLHS
jgi:hypothetical protein